MAPIRAFTAPGLLSMAPVLAVNVQEEPPLLHDELPWPGLRPMFSENPSTQLSLVIYLTCVPIFSEIFVKKNCLRTNGLNAAKWPEDACL
jgi:hypothetical protein